MPVKKEVEMIECKIEYFSEPGPENTEHVLRIAKERADKLGIKTILVVTGRVSIPG